MNRIDRIASRIVWSWKSKEVFDGAVFDHKSDGNSVIIRVKPDGSFYGDTGDFDFTAKSKRELFEKLTKWGYRTTPSGAEVVD